MVDEKSPSPADNECGSGVDGSNLKACSPPIAGDEKSPSPAVSAHCSGKLAADVEEEDCFYQKLNQINKSSGLSLLFNFRDTSIDLHEFYKIVKDRGGYHTVTKFGKWEEVASFATQKEKIRFTPTQIQNLYQTILYPFEQTDYYRTPVKLNESPTRLDIELVNVVHDSMGKRKLGDGIYALDYHSHDEESPSKKIEYDYGSWLSSKEMGTLEEKIQLLESLTKVKTGRKDPRAPLRSRNCYQMYLIMECDRLKSIHGDTPSAKLRDTIIEAWRDLPNKDKQPYIEASKKDKERYMKEMAAYEEQMRKEMEENKRKQPNQLKTTTHEQIEASKKDKERYTKEMASYEEQMRKEMEENKRKQPNQLKTTTHEQIEASKKDKERYTKEMASYEEQMRKEMEENKRKQPNQLKTTTHEQINFPSPTFVYVTPASQEPASGSHMIPHEDTENQEVVDLATPHPVQTNGDGITQMSDESTVQLDAGADKECTTK